MTQKQPKYTTMPTDSPEDFQSLKVYTKAVKNYLTNKLGASEQVAEDLVSKGELSSIGGILGRQIASVRNSNRAITSFTVKHKKSGAEFKLYY